MEKDKETDKDTDIKNMTERLEELLLRAERFGDRFGKQTEVLSSCEQGMARLKKELTLEVEELRNHRHAIEHDLMNTIEKAIQKTIKSVLPEQMPGLVSGFVAKTEAISEATIKKAETLNDNITQTVERAAHLIGTKKIEMTWRKLYLNVTFCVTSLLISFGIYYFFPTHTHIHYNMSDEMALIFSGGIRQENVW